MVKQDTDFVEVMCDHHFYEYRLSVHQQRSDCKLLRLCKHSITDMKGGRMNRDFNHIAVEPIDHIGALQRLADLSRAVSENTVTIEELAKPVLNDDDYEYIPL